MNESRGQVRGVRYASRVGVGIEGRFLIGQRELYNKISVDFGGRRLPNILKFYKERTGLLDIFDTAFYEIIAGYLYERSRLGILNIKSFFCEIISSSRLAGVERESHKGGYFKLNNGFSNALFPAFLKALEVTALLIAAVVLISLGHACFDSITGNMNFRLWPILGISGIRFGLWLVSVLYGILTD